MEYRDGYQAGAVRYDVGERSNFALLPMVVAALRLLLAWTPAAVEAHTRSLTTAVAEGARGMGFVVDEAASRHGHILGLRLPDRADPAALLTALQARGIHASLRGPALRLSPHLYNDMDDVGALLEGLESSLRAPSSSG